MSRKELCRRISGDRKNPIVEKDVFSNEIKVSHLKKIDKLFDKGLHYYLDPSPPPKGKETSVFFRKTTFNSDLNFGSHKVVNQYETLSHRLHAYAKLSEVKIERKLRVFSVKEDPQLVATEFHDSLLPKYIKDQKGFLNKFIENLSAKNIFVFEFIETYNKLDKANIDGFYIQPNVIVLKRQKYLKREIFSLAHELGHYLLNEEEVEEIKPESSGKYASANKVETWCNEFAFHLLAGGYGRVIDDLSRADTGNDYHTDFITEITRKTHLSFMAVYTRLLFKNKVSKQAYNNIKQDIEQRISDKEKKDKNKAKEGFSIAKAINSPLTISTLQAAYFNGVINEYDVSKTLNVKADKLEKYLQ
jgi:Zn-dependent peptidase ImmA (M78 family)